MLSLRINNYEHLTEILTMTVSYVQDASIHSSYTVAHCLLGSPFDTTKIRSEGKEKVRKRKNYEQAK